MSQVLILRLRKKKFGEGEVRWYEGLKKGIPNKPIFGAAFHMMALDQ